jgi:hypothetical protein
MPHPVLIYKNDFVKDIRKNLASHALLAVCQTPPFSTNDGLHRFAANEAMRCAWRSPRG